MKLLKLTMLAATVAIAATAFIGVSSASAHPPWIVLCREQKLLDCTNLIAHPLLGSFLLLLGPSKLRAGLTVECPEGMGTTEEETEKKGRESTDQSQQESVFKATLLELTLSGCTGCKKVEVQKNQPISIDMETQATESWRLHANNMRVTFSECTFGIKCVFEGTINLKLQKDEEGTFVDFENSVFTFVQGTSKGLCGEKMTWETGRTRLDWRLDDKVLQSDGTLGTIHKNVWLSLIEKLTLAEPVKLEKQ